MTEKICTRVCWHRFCREFLLTRHPYALAIFLNTYYGIDETDEPKAHIRSMNPQAYNLSEMRFWLDNRMRWTVQCTMYHTGYRLFRPLRTQCLAPVNETPS